MIIKATAPGRCGLIGTPSDMYGGSVISCSIVERATCELDDSAVRTSIEVSGVRQILSTSNDLILKGDRLDVARAVLISLGVDPAKTPPFSLSAVTDIPMQAGLAGSTAIIATITGVVASFLNLSLNRYQTAELVRKIESDVMQVICGFQDAYMTTFGGINYMDFRGKNSAEVTIESTPYATMESLQGYCGIPPIVLAHTGVHHHSGTVHKSLRERWLEGDTAARNGIEEIKQLAYFGKKAVLSADWSALADLMNQNHAIVRDLGGIATLFPIAQRLTVGGSAEKLISSSDSSMAVTKIGAGGGIDQDSATKGPLVLAAVDTIGSGGKQGRIVVVGSAIWMSNQGIGISQVGNRDLFLNMINWLTADEDLISIRPKEPEDRRIAVTGPQLRMIFAVVLILFPLLAIGSGIAMWVKRR